MGDRRVVFDFEVDFSNGGSIQGQDFRLDIFSTDISDEELADYVVTDLRLLMVGEVRILNKRIIEEKHKRVNFSDGCAYVDGTFVPYAEAKLAIGDWGFTKSDVAYDVVAVWDGAFFRLDDHLSRFEATMAHMHLNCPLERGQIVDVLNQCVARTGLTSAYVSMMTTRGINTKGTRDPRDCINAFYAYAVPYVWIVPEEAHDTGIDIHISNIERIPPESLDPKAKNFHWGDMMQALFQAYDAGGATALLVDRHGNVAEGPGFNVFALIDGTWVTPATGVLEGITRKTAMEIISDMGFDLAERGISPKELQSASEVFITSTAGGIMPVRRISGSEIGTGQAGPLTLSIREKYWELHADPRFATPVRYHA